MTSAECSRTWSFSETFGRRVGRASQKLRFIRYTPRSRETHVTRVLSVAWTGSLKRVVRATKRSTYASLLLRGKKQRRAGISGAVAAAGKAAATAPRLAAS